MGSLSSLCCCSLSDLLHHLLLAAQGRGGRRQLCHEVFLLVARASLVNDSWSPVLFARYCELL